MQKEDIINGKLFDLISVIVIAVIGLLTAYVTFGILESQANADIQKYSVSGAIAGAFLSWSLLASFYMQFRKSSGQLRDLYKRNEELRQKLIRGAPRPSGFESEVDERQRIVLARPEKWEPCEGIIFDFEMPESLLRTGDIFPAYFRAAFVSIKDTEKQEKFYENYIQEFKNKKSVGECASEFVYIGGEPYGIKSLKIISKQYAKSELMTEPWTGKQKRKWCVVTKEEFESRRKSLAIAPNQSKISSSVKPVVDEHLEIRQMVVTCYHEDLKKIFFFEFADDEPDFTKSSELFNQILNSIRFLT